jgi:hypothetical protein
MDRSTRSPSGALRLAACSIVLALASPAAHGTAAASVDVEAGAGRFSAFESDHRSTYGAAPVVTLGLSARIGDGSARAFLEAAYLAGSGSELAPDPTFVPDDARYRLVPLSLGVRADLVSRASRSPLRFFLGVAWQTVLTSFDGPFSASERTPTQGLLLEARPQARLGSSWSLWLCQRFSVLANARYDGAQSELDYSGSLLQIGLSRTIR